MLIIRLLLRPINQCIIINSRCICVLIRFIRFLIIVVIIVIVATSIDIAIRITITTRWFKWGLFEKRVGQFLAKAHINVFLK